jgi:hypothetical protein
MPPETGTCFGRYELRERLGAGGMGEVFRARDLVLLREVAIKLLPEPFASSPERLARFTREARTASALNHPNILTVHDIGQSEGHHFMVTEVVEGLTLRQVLRNERRLPVRRALDLAIQIAEGLARAHAAGVVHRDLKPANVMVTPEGRVKILDFGLAKLHCPTVGEAPESEVSDLPTWPGGRWTDIAVSDGSLVGTVGYVSPEQVRGRPVDHRSDQFAFGATLYEMLTGQRAFRRETRGETLAAITDGEPAEMARLNPDIPAPVRWVVERCLAKDPEERYNSTCDLAQTLRGLREHLPELERAQATVAAGAARRLRSLRGRVRLVPGQAATAAVAGALVVLGLVQGDNAPWSQHLGHVAGEPAVTVQTSGPSGPDSEDLFRDDPFLEVMTFRWTRRPTGAGSEPVVLEGRVERRLDWVRITARVVNENGSKGPRQVELSRGELLAIASAMAEVLDARESKAGSPAIDFSVNPEGGDSAARLE